MVEGGATIETQEEEFEPLIIAFCCNSVFFFKPRSAGTSSKERNGSKRNSLAPAPSALEVM